MDSHKNPSIKNSQSQHKEKYENCIFEYWESNVMEKQQKREKNIKVDL